MIDHPTAYSSMYPFSRRHLFALCASLAMLLGGCPSTNDVHPPQGTISNGPRLLRAVEFNDPITPTPKDSVALAAAKNETVSFTVEMRDLPRANEKTPPVLRLQPLRIGTGAAAGGPH